MCPTKIKLRKRFTKNSVQRKKLRAGHQNQRVLNLISRNLFKGVFSGPLSTFQFLRIGIYEGMAKFGKSQPLWRERGIRMELNAGLSIKLIAELKTFIQIHS